MVVDWIEEGVVVDEDRIGKTAGHSISFGKGVAFHYLLKNFNKD